MSHDRYAVIGDPIDQTLSPVMHNAAFAHAGIDAVYESVRVLPSELCTFMGDLRATFRYRGLNVTIPHKEAVGSYLDRLGDEARLVGAVNTVVWERNSWVGHNTDVSGFGEVLDELMTVEPGDPVVVVGAGGAARAVLVALSTRGALPLIVNRDVNRAHALGAALPCRVKVTSSAEWNERSLEGVRLLVNATALGMGRLSHLSPVPDYVAFPPGLVVFDLVYGHATPLLARARSGGCRVADGLEMLVRQGAAAFRLWTGLQPNLEVMRAACRSRLEEAQACSAS